jgi:hypothetical protein
MKLFSQDDLVKVLNIIIAQLAANYNADFNEDFVNANVWKRNGLVIFSPQSTVTVTSKAYPAGSLLYRIVSGYRPTTLIYIAGFLTRAGVTNPIGITVSADGAMRNPNLAIQAGDSIMFQQAHWFTNGA